MCLYAGRWNAACGTNQLGASWLSSGLFVIAAVTSNPPGIFAATVTSPTTATLNFWATQIDFSDAQPLSGTMELTGATLTINPTSPPFVIDGCNFEQYTGAFVGVQSNGGLGTVTRASTPPSNAVRALLRSRRQPR